MLDRLGKTAVMEVEDVTGRRLMIGTLVWMYMCAFVKKLPVAPVSGMSGGGEWAED